MNKLVFSLLIFATAPALSESIRLVKKPCYENDKAGALVLHGKSGIVKSFAKEIADSVGSEATWSFKVRQASCPSWVLVEGVGYEIINYDFYDLNNGKRISISVNDPKVTSLVNNQILLIAGCGSTEEGAEECRTTILRRKLSSGEWGEVLNDYETAHAVSKQLSKTSWELTADGKILKCLELGEKCTFEKAKSGD